MTTVVHSGGMKVICAPDKFKGSLTAGQAALAMRRGVERACPDAIVDLCPVADGGEGFLQTLYDATGGMFAFMHVTGPRPDGYRPQAAWLRLNDGANPPTAAIEMAQASGLNLLDVAERDPTRTTTFGTGQLIHAALHEGHHRLIIGIGGSATCDGGAGAAQAVGTRFYDRRGREITTPITGGMLPAIGRIDPDVTFRAVANRTLTVASDVGNPLTGREGSAYVYAPQKGATPEQVAMLDDGLRHLARLTREQVGVGLESEHGAGAAGGLGFGLMAYFRATLVRGIDVVLHAVHFDQRLRGCDLCLTGEGRLDGQSLAGKACIGVAKAAALRGVPAVALVGAAGPSAERAIAAGLSSYHVIGAGLSEAESMARASELVEEAAYRAVRERM